MIEKLNITGLILAGGAGTRVNGQDKGLIPWKGKPLIAHVINTIRPQVGELLISCNRNIETYRSFGCPIIQDNRPDFQGPLAGLEAARAAIKTDYLAVIACDTPALPHNLIERLASAIILEQHNAQISYAFDGQQEQYLCAVLDVRCLEDLTDFLAQGQRAVRHWYKRHVHLAVDFSDNHDAFQNHNHLLNELA